MESAQNYQMALNRWFCTQFGETTPGKGDIIWGSIQHMATSAVNEAPQSEVWGHMQSLDAPLGNQSETWGHMQHLDASPAENAAQRSKDDTSWGQLQYLKASPAMNEARRSEYDNNTWGHMRSLDAPPANAIHQGRKEDSTWGHIQFLDASPVNEARDETGETLHSLEMLMQPGDWGQLQIDKS